MGYLQSSLHFPKCKIFSSVGMVLTQKSTDLLFPCPPPTLKDPSQLVAAVSRRGEGIHKFFQPGQVPGKPQQHGHGVLLTNVLSQQQVSRIFPQCCGNPYGWHAVGDLQAAGKALHRSQCDFWASFNTWFAPIPALAGEVTNVAHERRL